MKTACRVLFCAALLAVSSAGLPRTLDAPYEVGTWPGFRPAAVSYTCDDNCSNQLRIAVPMFNEFGFKLTLFTVTDPTGLTEPNWPALRIAAAQGHEIAGHTVTHPRLNELSRAEQELELQSSQDAIDANIPSAKCLTLAYPYGALNYQTLTLARQHYIAARAYQFPTNQIESATPADFWQIKVTNCGSTGVLQTPDNFSTKFAATVASGGWCVLVLHGLDGDGPLPLPSPVLRTSLEYLAARPDTFWVATFLDAVRYIRERNTVSVKETARQGAAITLQVTDILDDTIYNLPLTLRRPLPEGWPAANVSQNGRTTAAVIVTIDSAKYVMFDVIPDAGDVILSRCPAAFPALYGDWTGDGTLKMDDLAFLSRLWLIPDCNLTAGADLNGDCTVTLHEFALFAQNWRQDP